MSIFASEELELAINVLDQDEHARILQGTRNAQLFTLGLFTWFAYEYVATFVNEVAFFWADREWTMGRGLFFVVRLSGLVKRLQVLKSNGIFLHSESLHNVACDDSITIRCISPESISCVHVCNSPTDYELKSRVLRCTRSIHVLLVTNIICIAIGQAYLSVKFWNIFGFRRSIRIGLVVGLGLSTVISLALLSFSDSHLIIAKNNGHLFPVSTGCKVYPPKRFWITYIPQLLFHAYLYLLAIYVAFLNRDLWKFSDAMRKVFWDGTVIFFVFLATSLCTMIFSSRTSTLWLSIPTTLCPITLTATSITHTRRAITTRMLLEQRSNAFESQDTMAHAIELMPLEFKRTP
ncbi:hypothetical protein AGABI2DRAFT_120213 [Agaricus bisporus var. bisporus H97]|uniref:hypothetical protein n=1 Tax=Agaricus bisporus var. bisporus (strain H97 / ATCC MYA-4626 / FGSC 10389) TaxID=936046 RepID=UPI00029F549C|nr:hypothetical protein AGABI2DRAFT_120213 [Agaricus bisporus var. bisporus H97]EKV45247.1 hypothetical protein AGABI2DRAFT_120213 [Agaricus bisporus var. bisporus H97]